MAYRKWLDNAFWETESKEQLNCILEMEDDVGRVTRQVMKLNKTDKEGNPNPMYQEVVDEVGEDTIDNETKTREDKKKNEKAEAEMRENEHVKARRLEELFNYKLQVFETEEIKNSKNRALKGKIRRAKSQVEVNLWAIEVMRDALGMNETEKEVTEDDGTSGEE
jgi:Mg2+ and Co2+ transporter CorA